MAKKNTTPTPFDDLLNSVYGNEGNMSETTNMDTQDSFVDVVEDEDKPADKPAGFYVVNKIFAINHFFVVI